MFALHQVLLPGQRLGLRVFEERYLRMMEEVLPFGPFVVVAIREGREVGGPAEPYGVGVRVAIEDHDVEELDDGGTAYAVRVIGNERLALVSCVAREPFPRWHVEPYPDEGGAGTEDVETGRRALLAYLRASGQTNEVPALPRDPVEASFRLAAGVPGLVPVRQGLLEAPGAGERLVALTAIYRREASLVRALGAVAGADVDVSPN